MPKYTLTLTWLTADNPDRYVGGVLVGGANYRRLQAIQVANQYSVTDPNGNQFHPYNQFITNQQNGAQWQVLGSDTNICSMIRTWTNYNPPYVRVTNGPANCTPMPPV
jgi:hypothetical protein